MLRNRQDCASSGNFHTSGYGGVRPRLKKRGLVCAFYNGLLAEEHGAILQRPQEIHDRFCLGFPQE
jgi:hypothetical protein